MACKDRTSEVCEDLRNVEQVRTAVNETPQWSVWRVFGDITNYTGVISVYRTLKFDLPLTPCKVSILKHLKEADITHCPSFANWITSHIDIVGKLWFLYFILGEHLK